MFNDTVKTELYKRREWPEHVRRFYADWLREMGLQANNARAFDRFVAFMEERMGDFLSDQCLDHSGLGLTRKDET